MAKKRSFNVPIVLTVFKVIIMQEIPYSSIFSSLSTFTGLPIRLRRNKWLGACRYNGESHSRPDKLVARLRNGKIQLIEQGQPPLTLWDWLLQYGGCSTNREVIARLTATSYDAPTRSFEPEVIRAKYIPVTAIAPSLGKYTDTLFLYLCTIFPEARVRAAYDLYQVGSCGGRGEKTIFWYANFSGIFRLDKIMSYLPDGHRDKSAQIERRFLVRAGYTDRCFFGEHLLTDWRHEHYIVESEKTAIIAYLYTGKTVLATGGSSCLAEIGSGSILLPDYDDAGRKWSEWGVVSEWWKNFRGIAPEEGWDIGDMIIEKITRGRQAKGIPTL